MLSDTELLRYSRQIMLPSWGEGEKAKHDFALPQRPSPAGEGQGAAFAFELKVAAC